MSLPNDTPNSIEVVRVHPEEPVGGAIIDAQGREVPITEDMVQDACRELEKRLIKPSTAD
jgi:hypothetical protein